ncbi:hypothetical protein M9H77_14108 [Catharanthus roseus]|uniref:Uncharacterized protein n=1 Tax=Catharanthus roseus TaxID=4058 RepID=A0ACC0BM34_CATRO|nr:hypothetical protein M9H77_14108 [Catharanthus roseus]
MEEVSAHVYPGPIVPDVLSRQHKHRSSLIWSGDHETCFTDLQCRRFGRNLFQCYSTALCRLFVWLPYLDRALVLSDLWQAEIPLICFEIVEYHYPELTFMSQEVDDMASVVIQEPPSSPSQMAVFAKKVQMIIRRCMTIPIQHSRHHPREYVPDWGARRVKRGVRGQPGRGAGGGRPSVPPFPGRHEHVDLEHVEVERGERSGGVQPTTDPFDSRNLDMPSFSLGLTPPSQSLPSGSGTEEKNI